MSGIDRCVPEAGKVRVQARIGDKKPRVQQPPSRAIFANLGVAESA